MTNRIAVGTPVTVRHPYTEHEGRTDLVVLADLDNGYGVGFKGNDPTEGHNVRRGWVYYPNSSVFPKATPKKESNTVDKFNKGDKVEVFQDGHTNHGWVGVQGIVQKSLGYGYHVELTDPAQTGERIGYVAYLTGSNLKLIEETTFKVGDRVEFVEHYMSGAEKGVKATVIKNLGEYTEVRTDAGKEFSPFSYRLKLVEEPKPFTFKDIQKGDTIRRTAKHVGGATEVREGVVTKKGGYFWANDNYILAYDTDDAPKDVTLELLNRPEPVKEVWETAKPGDKLVVKNESGTTRVLTKLEDGQWDALLIHSNGGVGKGFKRSNEALKTCLKGSDFSNDKPKFVPA